MTNFIKLFRKNEDGSIQGFPYDLSENYYAFIQRIIAKGYTQCILTTDIMLKAADHFLLYENGIVTSLELYEDDDELSAQLADLINKMRTNKAYWSILKEKLNFLSDDAIDVETIEICGNKKESYKVVFHVNGIVEMSCNDEESLEKDILRIIGAYIK
ncbi:hypothetical protein ACTQ1N_12110 [Porcincola sp. LCP21S3_C12]|uniref:hypothetical protein n=1 Tax=Porcincola sp. LCP21S3_C12 TaxID=3438798 RepID=UPI003F9A0FA5